MYYNYNNRYSRDYRRDYRDGCDRMFFDDHHDDCNDFDMGPNPVVVNLNEMTKLNKTFRTSVWTGEKMQTIIMCVPPCASSGVFCVDSDWFINVVCGELKIELGKFREDLCYCKRVPEGCSILIPAGTWCRAGNACTNQVLKLLEFYAPPQFPRGTVQCTKEEAEAEFRNMRD